MGYFSKYAGALHFSFLKKRPCLNIWKHFGVYFGYSIYCTEYFILFAVLFPEIPQILEISGVSGPGNSSASAPCTAIMPVGS